MNETHFNIPATPKDAGEMYERMQTAWYMMVFGFSQYTKHTLALTLSTCHTNITHTDPHLSPLFPSHTHLNSINQFYQSHERTHKQSNTRLSIHPTDTNTISFLSVSYTCTHTVQQNMITLR